MSEPLDGSIEKIACRAAEEIIVSIDEHREATRLVAESIHGLAVSIERGLNAVAEAIVRHANETSR